MQNNLLYWSENSQIYIDDTPDHGKVVIKHLNQEYPSPKSIKQFYNEHQILEGLDIVGLRKAHYCSKENNKFSICLEYVEGVTLSEYFETKPALKDLITVFINITDTLEALHQLHIIHRDISPANLLVDPITLETNIIDFGISTKYNLRIQNLGNPDKLEGTLAYMSPEQTGRMNRQIDFRSDLYSLGVVMFEGVFGELPFLFDDPLEIVHGHIAITPKVPSGHKETIPEPIIEIVLKLLSKNAEDRYQSVIGLRHDLLICQHHLDKEEPIKQFKVGGNDLKSNFLLVQKLYGREKETNALLESFERTSQGERILMLVSGYSGTGKSALVAEIYKPVTEKKGYFIDGKFDQFQKALPYFAILHAFNEFIDLLLREEEHVLNYYRDEISEAIGHEGQVLTKVLPKLELIIGPQEELPEISGEESRNRFKYIFSKFLKSICSFNHPVVLFIDDMQWADSSSLDLLSSLLLENSIEHFLCICAYRDNEVSASHPFAKMIRNLEEENANIEKIKLDNLKLEDVNQLISDALELKPVNTRDLAQLIFDKTRGNAFYTTEFFKSLYEDEKIIFNQGKKVWEWNIAEIEKLNVTENVVEFMARKIAASDEKTKEILTTAACIGTEFNLKILSSVLNLDSQKIINNIDFALKEGWLFSEDENYQFAHDRIQQAVYSLLSEEKKKEIHYIIGSQLLKQLDEEGPNENVFTITNHFNSATELITSSEEKEKLVELNLSACHLAKENSAFDEAYNYAITGITHLNKDAWQSQTEQCLSLNKEAAEIAYLTAKFDEMDHYIEEVLANAENELDQVDAYIIRINAHKARNQLKEAIETGLSVLEKLGERFPKKPGMHHVLPNLLKTIFKLRKYTSDDIINLDEITDMRKASAMHILSKIAPSTYWYIPALFPLVILRIVQLSLKYGTNPVSAFGFSAYGVIQVGVLNKSKEGYKYGEIGLRLLDKYDAKEWITQVYTAIYGLIFIWRDHVKTTLKPLVESYHIGLETGALEFACINANLYCINSFLIGKQLDGLEEEVHDFSETFKRYKQGINHLYNEVYHQAILNLMQEVSDPNILQGTAFDEVAQFEANIVEDNRTGTFYIYFLKIILGNYFDDPKSAWEHIAKAEPLLDSVLAKLELVSFALHAGLAAAKYYDHPENTSKNKNLKVLKKNIKKLKSWSEGVEDNFLHRAYLLEAELNRIKGNELKAKNLYDQSIKLAGKYGYLNDEALANERAGIYYINLGNQTLGSFYIKNAYQVYRYWGAKNKLNKLNEKYPEYVGDLVNRSATNITSFSNVGTTHQKSSALDLQTFLKASTAISENIVLSELLENLITIVAENVGANYAVLLLVDKNQLSVESILENNEVRNLHESESVQYSDFDDIPKSVLKYVQRTQEPLNISNVTDERNFYKDPYITTGKPKSILVFPINNKQELSGLMYLENSMTQDAFSESSIELINLLSGQIAVSIENARLYDNLEQKVLERTTELAEEKRKSDDLLLNILPAKTAAELKDHGKATPRRHEMVSVIFTDFVKFTKIADNLSPEDLVELISLYFEEFDRIIKKYGVEKIKTIGDAYMAVSGLPSPTDDHALNAVKAALEIRDFVEKIKLKNPANGARYFDIRIGISSGPVIAGVVGLHKFAYDIWGDTVNVASRLETNSMQSKVNISQSTYNLIKDHFDCDYRGRIDAKNIGQIDMYFVENK